MQPLELLLDRRGERLLLRSPEVGLFTRALDAGAWLAPRAAAGLLHALGRSFELVAPPGASGRVTNEPPELVLAPVGYGSVLYELEPLEAGPPSPHPPAAEPARSGVAALVFRAPHGGRFWHRPAPLDAPFVQEGDVLTEGRTIGLVEVMKTFTHLVYAREGELPPQARVVRVCAEDGAEIEAGSPLLELERA